METCCDDDVVEGYPDLPPPCTTNTCSLVWSSLRDSLGRLAATVRLRGGSLTKTNDTDAGVLRCFSHTDGTHHGLDVDIFGDPADLAGVTCTDAAGNSLYSNPLRRIANTDGSVSLGVLPFPTQDTICSEEPGCGGIAPEGEADSVFTGCARTVSTTITNPACYPMIVTPKVTLVSALTGSGTTYELQANINGTFDTKVQVFTGACCAGDSAYQSTTLEWPPVEIAAGESFSFSVDPSIRYNQAVDTVFNYNFGDIRVCLDGRSKVTADTITALEGTA